MTRLRPRSPLSIRSVPCLLGILALFFAVLAAPDVAWAKAPVPPRVKLDVTKYELPNGLDVILCKNDRLPTVGVNVWYHVGPANEEPGRTGFAHLFEHMMFKGSRHVADGAHWTHLQTAGASLINGTTGPTISRTFHPISSRSRSGSRATAWDSCSTAWTP
jgi:hypothetical protein